MRVLMSTDSDIAKEVITHFEIGARCGLRSHPVMGAGIGVASPLPDDLVAALAQADG